MNEEIKITNTHNGIVLYGDNLDWVRHKDKFAVVKELMDWLDKIEEKTK